MFLHIEAAMRGHIGGKRLILGRSGGSQDRPPLSLFYHFEVSGIQMEATLMILKKLGGYLGDFGGPQGGPGGTDTYSVTFRFNPLRLNLHMLSLTIRLL